MARIKNVSDKPKLVQGVVLYPGDTRPVSDLAAQSLIAENPDAFEIVGSPQARAASKKKKKAAAKTEKQGKESQPPLEPPVEEEN